jgi:hypothetical protein
MSDTPNYEQTQSEQPSGEPQQVDNTQPAQQGDTDRLLDNFMRDTDGPARGVRQTPDGTQAPQRQAPQARTGQPQGQQPPASGAQPRAPATIPQIPQATRTYGNLFLADSNGDIYDAQGRIVAKQGYGRSIFHKLYPYIEATATENAALRSRVEGFENANAVARQNGLSVEDYGAALHLMVQWKKNPVETINTLLRVAQERGNDVSSIRGGSGVDPAALRSMVEEVVRQGLAPFQPIVEQTERSRQQAIHDSEVLEQYNEFMRDFPDATPHQESIANVMHDHGMNAREAYFALRAFAAQHQLNWNSDLKPQLMARQTQPNGQAQPPAGNGRMLPPMGGGRGNGVANTPPLSMRGSDTDESWNSIIKRTFAQHGIDVQ